MPNHPCSAIVLAGGRSTRMGGADKALVQFAGQPLIAHVLARLAPQVDDIVINCNRNEAALAAFGRPLARDESGDYQGPLAGILAALPLCRHDLVLVVPCDSPFLPGNLVQHLQDAMTDAAGLAVAHDGHRLQPLFMLMPRSLAASLRRWLAQGNRKVEDWCAAEGAAIARFDDAAAFRNLNTAQDLALAEKEGGNDNSRTPG